MTELKLVTLDAPADGGAVLARVRDALTRYVALPSGELADAITLWIAATHGQAYWQHAPRLVIRSPEKRCGKSRLLDVIFYLTHRPVMTVNATPAAIFRTITDDDPPTLLVDEADTIFGGKAAENHEELRALLNAGHQRGRPALRCVGVGAAQHAAEFPTFAMAAIAGIGSMPDTVEDRSVIVPMRRRAPTEQVTPFRTRRDRPGLETLCAELGAWIAANGEELAGAEPDMPVEDRAADTWEPLIAVADLAGGDWPARARKTALLLCAAHDASAVDASLGVRLLTDIAAAFQDAHTSFIPSRELVNMLHRMGDSPWRDFDISMNRLAYRLRDYGVHPRPNPAKTDRGYHAGDFRDAFARYLPSGTVHLSVNGADQQKHADTLDTGGQFELSAEKELSAHNPRSEADTDSWTVRDTPAAEDDGEGDELCALCFAALVINPGEICTDCKADRAAE
ncbi:MAG TPA: DUF3631 domain-containing protein [Streptosporangiaceae bacterium]|nr:DUF3631 domain-containing protein [Streptosporangiaceae bacterium]